MPAFDIVKESEIKKTFRTECIKNQYDLQMEKIKERFSGNIELPEKWNVGIIVGASGTGKTTIAKSLFPKAYSNKFKYNSNAVIDNIDQDIELKEISKVFNSVGFSSPPSWLKQYSVLSNGEKMRMDLARCILEKKDLIVFDEFTSVVDRNVAKMGSFAMQKTIRKINKKFIAVSCHYDILEWLEPDWIFDTNNMSFKDGRSLRRPKIKIKVYKEKGKWEFFQKYHYLNHEVAKASHQYVGYIENNPVCFCAVLHQPNNHKVNLKRISRLVVLPDYQGIGIGVKFLNIICDYYIKNNFEITIRTSSVPIIKSLKKDKKWALISFGRIKGNQNMSNRASSKKRLTFSFKYKKSA
jgi:ABC-type dipeptide/oligopeptide/nickel transport system ATPase subunit